MHAYIQTYIVLPVGLHWVPYMAIVDSSSKTDRQTDRQTDREREREREKVESVTRLFRLLFVFLTRFFRRRFVFLTRLFRLLFVFVTRLFRLRCTTRGGLLARLIVPGPCGVT